MAYTIPEATAGLMARLSGTGTFSGARTVSAAWTFSAAGTAVTIDNDLRALRIGIGTAPDTTFHIHTAAGVSHEYRVSDADVAHGITDIVPTNVILSATPTSGTTGGYEWQAFSEDGGTTAFSFKGTQGGTPSEPVIKFVAFKKSGTGRVALTGTDIAFQFRTPDTASLLTILGNGNIGIGRTSLEARLDVDNQTSTDSVFIARDNTTTVWQIPDGGWPVWTELTANPGTGVLPSLAAFAVYMKADRFIIGYNLSGTINYLSIALDGSTTAWTHNTTAP